MEGCRVAGRTCMACCSERKGRLKILRAAVLHWRWLQEERIGSPGNGGSRMERVCACANVHPPRQRQATYPGIFQIPSALCVQSILAYSVWSGEVTIIVEGAQRYYFTGSHLEKNRNHESGILGGSPAFAQVGRICEEVIRNAAFALKQALPSSSKNDTVGIIL